MAHAFLVDIIAFAKLWEEEQTGEENKGDKHSIDTIWHKDILLVNEYKRLHTVAAPLSAIFLHLWWQARKPKGSLFQSAGL